MPTSGLLTVVNLTAALLVRIAQRPFSRFYLHRCVTLKMICYYRANACQLEVKLSRMIRVCCERPDRETP